MAGLRRERLRKSLTVMAIMMAMAVSASCGSEGGKAKDGSQPAAKAGAQAAGETDKAVETEESKDSTQAGKTQQETCMPISVNNDTVELGTLAVFEPSDNLEANSGRAIAGSDEEQLQQERIAGGAVGEVVSENLEPLNGITDYSEGEFVIMYGVTEE